MADEILPPQGKRQQPLSNRRLHTMHREQRIAAILEAARQPRNQRQPVVRKPEQEHAAVRRQRASRKIYINPALPLAPGKWTTEVQILTL